MELFGGQFLQPVQKLVATIILTSLIEKLKCKSIPLGSTKESLLEPLSKSKVSGEDFFIYFSSPVDGVFAWINIGTFAALFRDYFHFWETRITAFRAIFP